MPSNHQTFWSHDSFAVVGFNQEKKFPALTYRGLRKLGKTVFAVDPSAESIEGDPAFSDLTSLPQKVEAVVLELPRERTQAWLEQAEEQGIKDVWIHMNCETPSNISWAKEKGINLRTGTCAVMYVTPGFSFHSFHRWARKLSGKF